MNTFPNPKLEPKTCPSDQILVGSVKLWVGVGVGTDQNGQQGTVAIREVEKSYRWP